MKGTKERNMAQTDTEFCVVQNRLDRRLPMLRVKNALYEIKIYYSGDYASDMKDNTVDRLKIRCVTKAFDNKNTMMIDPVNDLVDITLLANVIRNEEIDIMVERLLLAKKSLLSAKTILGSYFKI